MRASTPNLPASAIPRLVVAVMAGALIAGGIVPAVTSASAAPPSSPSDLRVEWREGAADIENTTDPRLSWSAPAVERVYAGDPTVDQVAYQVRVATSAAAALSDAADIWDSGRIGSSATAVPYAGPTLEAPQRYWYTVRTWNGRDEASEWADPVWFGTTSAAVFDEADPIWAGGPSVIWTDYTFSGTFTIPGTVTSKNATLSFRGQDGNNYYMWQFQQSSNSLVAHVWKSGAFTVLKTVPLAAAGITLTTDSPHAFEIEAFGSTITTRLDGVTVDTLVDESYSSGWIGVRTGLTESTFFDDFRVVARNGTELYLNDFSTAADIPCGTVSGGQLSVATGQKCLFDPWANYTLALDVKVNQTAAGIYFRAASATNAYMWQFRAGESTLAPHTNVNGTFTKLVTTNVPLGSTLAVGSTYPVRIVATGSSLSTYFNNTLVETRTNTTFTRGTIGFRHGSSESGTFSNVRVTSPSGYVIYRNDFASGNADFSCGSVTSNTLVVGNSGACALGTVAPSWVFARGDVTLLDKPIAWATLSATGASTRPARQYVYKAFVNGEFVGLGPTFPIGSEARYDGYDVTELVRRGSANTIGAVLYSTSDQRFVAQLVVHYTDGTEQAFGTGDAWTTLPGSSVYPSAGSIGTTYFVAPKENVQAQHYPVGFDAPGFDDSAWTVAEVKADFATVVATPTAKVEQRTEAPVTITERAPNDYVIDFGRSWAGGVALDLTALGGENVDIRYGEVMSGDSVKYAMSTGNNYQDVWTLAAGENRFETWGLRVFRYVQVIGAPEPITADNIAALAYVYPVDTDEATFESSDADLERVWELSRHTIESQNVNIYTDSWTRERGPYEADAYIQQLAHAAISRDPTLGIYSMDYLIANRTWPTEWPLYTILSVHDAWQATGSTEQIEQNYAALTAKLPTGWIDSATGLIRKTPGSSSSTNGDLVDWPTSERDGYVFTSYNTVINSLAYATYVDMAAMATAVGQTADAETFTAIATRLRDAINDMMYDPTVGAYADGLNSTTAERLDHYALHASAFALAFGVPEDDEAPRVAEWIDARGMACSVYCAAFMLDGLYLAGAGEVSNDFMTDDGLRSWISMIETGAGATMEAWSLSIKSNTTYSHPWAASPAYLVPTGLLGIRPVEPGYRIFSVTPQPGDIHDAVGTMPTVNGVIGVSYAQRSGGVDIGVSVPTGTSANVSIPAGDAVDDVVYVDGRAVTATPDGDRLVVEGVLSGCHVLSTSAGAGAASDPLVTRVCADGYAAPPIDTTAPTVNLTVSAAASGGWYGAGATVTVTSTDDLSGVATTEYRLDTGSWLDYTAPFEIADGTHVVETRATDAVGNVDLGGPYTVGVDSLVPGVTVTVDSDRRLVAGATDAGSGVASLEYRLGAGGWMSYSSPVQLGNEAVTVVVRAVDVAGNARQESVAVAAQATPVNVTSAPGTSSGSESLPPVAVARSVTLDAPSPVMPGSRLRIAGSGFVAGDLVDVGWMASSALGSTAVADGGAFALAVEVPDDTRPGEYSLEVRVNGVWVADFDVVVSDEVEPTSPAEPAAGPNETTPHSGDPGIGGWLIAGAVLLVLVLSGGAPLLVAWRRRV